jgi:lipoprotein signal peptidase
MNSEQTIDYITQLRNNTQVKKEKKILTGFLIILSDLKTNPIIEKEPKLYEKTLDQINLDSSAANKGKSYQKELHKYMKRLKDNFNLVSEGYYRNHGIAFGMIIGISIGSAYSHSNGIAFGISLGMIFGMAIGSNMDTKAQKQGRAYRTKEKN